MAAVILSPLKQGTSVPTASIRLAVSQPIPEKIIPAAPAVREADVAEAAIVETLSGVVTVSAAQPHYSARLLRTSDALSEAFQRLGYDLELVRVGETGVPRLFLASLPGDLKDIPEVADRKALFLKTVLPLVLQANEVILRDRRRLWRLHAERQMGRQLGPVDRLWLMVMGERYRVRDNDIETLLRRVDIIPPSLALAQAAEESGWGTSRFVREGNAVFGQWTFSEMASLIPARRDDDKFHKVRSFPSLTDSVKAYLRNLNTHRAYRKLRQVRYALRLKGAPLEGFRLAEHLHRYSQRGVDYIAAIRTIIEANSLHHLDDARLRDGRPVRRPLI